MLKIYNRFLLDLLNQKNIQIIVATGLSQKPFKELKFYYRLKNHAEFLNELGIKFKSTTPRMTRDFLITFDDFDQAEIATNKLSKILIDNKIKLFGEIDNRGKDVFVTLTYPYEVNDKTKFYFGNKEFQLIDFVVFVAIKNGEHQGKGFAYFSEDIKKFAPPKDSHISHIFSTISNFFGAKVD